jgi:hypothetical protein
MFHLASYKISRTSLRWFIINFQQTKKLNRLSISRWCHVFVLQSKDNILKLHITNTIQNYRQRIFPLAFVQTGSGAHPASCPVGTGGKARPGCDADHLPHLVPSSRMSRSFTSSLLGSCMAIAGQIYFSVYSLS